MNKPTNHSFLPFSQSSLIYFYLSLSLECSNYQLLEEADRSLTAPGGFKDDSQLQFGWYRFHGAAGTMMSTTCTPTNQCGTHATGWLQGQHPTQSEGAITVKVCFHWTNCCQFPVSIQVRNCGSFYVYQLIGTPGLLRYCGTGAQSKKRANPLVFLFERLIYSLGKLEN